MSLRVLFENGGQNIKEALHTSSWKFQCVVNYYDQNNKMCDQTRDDLADALIEFVFAKGINRYVMS